MWVNCGVRGGAEGEASYHFEDVGSVLLALDGRLTLSPTGHALPCHWLLDY